MVSPLDERRYPSVMNSAATHWLSLSTAPGVDRAIVTHAGGSVDSQVTLNVDGDATDRVSLSERSLTELDKKKKIDSRRVKKRIVVVEG